MSKPAFASSSLFTTKVGVTCLSLALMSACGQPRQGGDTGPSTTQSTGDQDSGLPTGGDSINDDSHVVVTCAEGQIIDGFGYCRTTCASGVCDSVFEQCDLALGLCVAVEEIPSCDPTACPDGWVCPEPGSAEDDGSAACMPGPAGPGGCGSTDDCPFTERCEDGACVSRVGDIVMTCESQADCGLLLQCQLGVCIGCLDDLQCTLNVAGSKCVAGVCIVADVGPGLDCIDLDCPDGERCNLQTGVCEPTCNSHADCEEGELCAPGLQRCVVDFMCKSSDDCPEELTCAGVEQGLDSGVCVGCDNDTRPCGERLVCVLGACFPNLDGNARCASVTCDSGDLCDPADGSCYAENGTCSSADGCREGHQCNFLGFCSGCSLDGDCRAGQRCLFGTCLPL